MSSPAAGNSVVRFGTVAALGLAGALLAVWWWSHVCRFPEMVWNDVRVAPAVALARGWPIYPTLEHGTINTWVYGPLPLILFRPAAWATNAENALLIAGLINLTLILGPLALVCFTWPVPDGAGDDITRRFVAFLLSAALWPRESYAIVYADTAAIAFGLLANLLLIRANGASGRWLAAFFAVGAVACKQTALGIPLAQIVWLAASAGAGAAVRQAVRCAGAGVVIGGLALATVNPPGLWFTAFTLPSHYRMVTDLAERLYSVAPQLAVQVLAPAIILGGGWRGIMRSTLALPTLTWLCCLPFGVAALLQWGGRMNSMHSFWLWIAPALLAVLHSGFSDRSRGFAIFVGAAVTAALSCLFVAAAPTLPLRPQFAAYREAERLAESCPDQIWFPFHPLLTLFGDRRYYHDEDGLHVWQNASVKIPPARLAAGLPPKMRVIALHRYWTDWGIARAMIPPHARKVSTEHWNFYLLPSSSPP